MTGLAHLWGSIWPNLVADLVWVPLAGAYHWWARRHFTRIHTAVRELHERLDDPR